MGSPPPGLSLLRALLHKELSRNAHRGLVLILTFFAYACYHASRKPPSIVKSVLDPGQLSLDPAPGGGSWPFGPFFIQRETQPIGSRHVPGWPPFNNTDGTARLGEIDVAFLACYSLGMYAAGHLGDSLNLRYFLAFGMIGSGAFVMLFGMGYFWDLHVFRFYLAVQMLAGLLQATGWPSVVAVVGNWFGGRKRGLIMGIWNAHTSVGNISGSLLAASVLQDGWGWSFILPGALIVFGGILVLLFLAAYPEDVGFGTGKSSEVKAIEEDEEHGKEVQGTEDGRQSAVGFVQACSIPGVISFALCLFFAKLVAYTFLYWLPFYLSHTGNSSRCSFSTCWNG